MDKKIILFGAGKIGKYCLDEIGASEVYAFCDNYTSEQEIYGKKVIKSSELEQIHEGYQVVISVGSNALDEIVKQLESMNIPYTIYLPELRNQQIKRGEYHKIEDEGIFTDKFVEFVKNKKPQIFANIGAATGGYASIAAYFMDENSEIYVFEPVPEFVSSLKYFFSEDSRFHIVDKAVSNQAGTTELFATVKQNANNIAHSFTMDQQQTMFKTEYNDACQTISHEVETIVLDDFFENKDIDLILIDIEGAEVLALEGMERLIEKRKTTFFLEIHEPYIKAIRSDGMTYINEIFKKNNYKIYWCELDENCDYKDNRGGVRLVPSDEIRWEHCIVSPESMEEML